MSHHLLPTFSDFWTLLLFSFVVQIIQSAPPEGTMRIPFRPSHRFPVHFKGTDGGKRALEEKISGRLNSNFPPITDVTPTETAKVKIFEIGTSMSESPTAVPSISVGSNRLRISTSTTKSLLDETEPIGSEAFPTEPEPRDEIDIQPEEEDVDTAVADEEVEPVGQETLYGGIFGGTTATLLAAPLSPPQFIRSPYTAQVRPSVSPFGITGSTSFRPGPSSTVTLPVATRPPVGPIVPVLGVGPSPSVTSVGPPSPPPGSGGLRSLFSNSGGSGLSRRPGVVRNRDAPRRGVLSSRVMGTTVSTAELNADVITDFVFSEIKCYRTKQKEYFGAKIHLKNGFHVPYIRDRPDDPLTSSDCSLEPTRDSNTFHMKMTDLRGCGVEQCGDSMCVTMVFPRVPTLALADDEVTTIKCLPQKSSMAEMKTISFAGDSLENRRSGSTVEGGGQDFAAEVGVFRQNPGNSNGLFVKRVNSGGVVQLGEPLQLRSVVRGGDGWTFSKLTDVKVWRMRDSYASIATAPLNPDDASEVISLVDGRGCRNGEFRVIADSDPLRDPRNDLVHHFTFKAFLFRGQRTNEPLIVTAKVQACQERDDCDFTDCGATVENDESRYKRSLLDDPSSNSTRSNSTSMNWSSQLALRVVSLKDLYHPSTDEFDSNDFTSDPVRVSTPTACADKMGLSAFVASFLTVLMGTLIWTLLSFCRRGKQIENKFQKTVSFIHKMEDGRRDVRQIPTNPDYVRTPSSARANKPLPPIPQSSLADRGSNPMFPVAKLLEELADEGREYASVRTREEADEDDDGVYVVYYKRSSSAPATLRQKIQPGQRGTMTDVDDSEEDWQEFGHCPRQTVRSVKKRSQRRRKMRRERKEIPFPGVTGSSQDLRSTNQNLGGSRTSIRIGSEQSDRLNPSSSKTMPSAFSPSNSSSNFSATKPSATFVTRNEGSTQIIIIPETNV